MNVEPDPITHFVRGFGNLGSNGWRNSYNLSSMIINNYNDNNTFGIRIYFGSVRVILNVVCSLSYIMTNRTGTIHLLLNNNVVSSSTIQNYQNIKPGELYPIVNGLDIHITTGFDQYLTGNSIPTLSYNNMDEKIHTVQIKAYSNNSVDYPFTIAGIKVYMKIYY